MTPLRRIAALALLLLVPFLGACGFNAQTDQDYQPAEGVNNRSGSVDVLNALVVSAEKGVGTLVATLVNNDQEVANALVNVTGQDIAGVDKRIDVPAAGLVNLADKGEIALRGSRIQPGNFISLRLIFDDGQRTSIRVPVVANTGDYAGVPVPGEPSGGESPSATPTDD